jgi:integrase/recombinase XerD
MLVLWRRHEKDCPHKAKGRKYQKCRCPIWVDWRIDDRRIRKPIGLRDWQLAQQRAREWEADGIASKSGPITIEEVCDRFLKDAQARGLRDATLYKYRLLLRQMKQFANEHGLVFINAFSIDWTRRFRETWPNKNLGARKKLEYLRAFFRFANVSGWLETNPALMIKPPKTTDAPTLPFADEEVEKILKACDVYPHEGNRARLRALVLLLRYSGLRIGDAVRLSRDQIAGNRLELYTAKTGIPVSVLLPPVVLDALNAVPSAGNYYFWSGQSKAHTVAGVWQESLKKLCKIAGVPNGHAHRFRDTFAIALLLADVPLERVAKLLGHRSTRITEKHYEPWIPKRQEQLDQDVQRAWKAVAPVRAAGNTVRTRARVGHVRKSA